MERRLRMALLETGGARVACVVRPGRVTDAHGPAGSSGSAHHAGAVPLDELRRHLFAGRHDAVWLPRLGLLVGSVEPEGARVLLEHPAVRAVHLLPPKIEPPLLRPREHRAGGEHRTWGLARIEVLPAWERGLTGRGTEIGHLDSGVDADHPALRGRVVSFHEVTPSLRARRVAPRWHDPHGTHTAGTLLGAPVNGTEIGVARNARLHSALIDCSRDDGGVEQMLVATEALLDERARGANLRVLSVSLAATWEPPNVFDHWAAVLRENGILPVAAIGNAGPGGGQTPGNCRRVLAVGALDRDGTVRRDSGDGHYRTRARPGRYEKPDVLAPGDDVLSALAGHDRGARELMSEGGTSMATPHVAGVAALLFEAWPGATVDQVETAITATCRPLPGVPRQRQGHGVISAKDAVEALSAAMQDTQRPRGRSAARAARTHQPGRARKGRPARAVHGTARPRSTT